MLAVSFGSGISKPRTISIASLNIQGCKHLEEEKEQGKGKGADKLELLVKDFVKDGRDVLLLQHTGVQARDQLDLPAADGTGIKYFVHGVTARRTIESMEELESCSVGEQPSLGKKQDRLSLHVLDQRYYQVPLDLCRWI